MTIVYPLNIPNQADIAEMTLIRSNRVGLSTSPFTYEMQLIQHQGQRWETTVELNALPRNVAEEWRAWLAALMGPAGTFLMGDPLGVNPRGSAGGTPMIRVESQSGNLVDIYAAEVSVNSWLVPGDYMQIGDTLTAHFHRVLNIVTTNASGAAVVDIWPRLRGSPASGSAISVQSTVGIWRLIPGSESETLVTPNNIRLSFSAVEAL